MVASSFNAESILDKLRPTANSTQETATPPVLADSKATATETQRGSSLNDSDSDDEIVHKDAQLGVQKIEATTQAWSKSHLILAYFM